MCGISWRARWSEGGVGVPENGKDGGTIPGKSTICNRRFSIFINGWKFPLSFHFVGCVQWRIHIMAKNHGKLWSNHFHSKANVENYTHFFSLKKGYLFEPLEMWQNIGLIGLKGFAIDIPRPTTGKTQRSCVNVGGGRPASFCMDNWCIQDVLPGLQLAYRQLHLLQIVYGLCVIQVHSPLPL